MKRALPIIVVMLFLAGIFIVPAGVTHTPARSQETPLDNVTLEQDAELSWLPADRTVRVAVYSESNTTDPDYATYPGIEHNNATGMRNILLQYGYDVDILIASDISSFELTTANYDVFVMVDNFPRENITERILDFWQGGGGILAFDGSAGFLCYFGVLPPDAALDDGYPGYWDYGSQDFIIENRHPVSKGYQENQVLTMGIQNCLMWDWSALQGSTIGSDLTMIASSSSNANDVAILAYEPSTGLGGKVVTIAADNDGTTFPELDQMIADAVEWMTPSPKGRVAYDLSHYPYYGVDSYDEDYTSHTTLHTIMRNDIVSRGYTFDKLYPSAAGNLTTTNLELYDVIIINNPGYNFTAQEVTDVTNWVSSGGSLFVIADHLNGENQNLNYLLSNTNMRINNTGAGNTQYPVGNHATHEGATTISCAASGTINYTAPAFPIWDDGAGNVVVALEEFGSGRISIAADSAFFRDGGISASDNRDVAINLMNWLSASQAEVLLMVNEHTSPNRYKTPVALALNDLGIPFYLTIYDNYLNLSLNIQSWDMVIIDAPSYSIATSYIEEIAQYVEAGGHLIMSYYSAHTTTDHRLWPLLGFNLTANMPDSVPIHIWDVGHEIYNIPNDYGVSNFTPVYDYGTEGDILNVFSNGTALAGLTSTVKDNESIIVLRNDGQTLYNGYLIDQFNGDLDDSTYEDSFELWQNEIAFMMRPTIDSPTDIEYEFGDTVGDLTWICDSDRPLEYEITLDSVFEDGGAWDGSSKLINIDGLDVGTYTYEITVSDTAGYSETDEVIVTVVDTTLPEWVETPTNLVLDYDAIWYYDVNATDLSGISTYFMNDTTNFDIDSTGILTNNTFLDAGVYGLNISVEDNHGNVLSKVINITVSEEVVTTTATTTTTDTSPTDTTTPPPGDPEIIVIVIIIGALIVIIIIVMKKKKS